MGFEMWFGIRGGYPALFLVSPLDSTLIISAVEKLWNCEVFIATKLTTVPSQAPDQFGN
jgi:hypothetical protein